jgi:hypothetical protein
MPRVDLQELLERKQAVLAARLGLSGAFDHPTAQGDVKEFNWVQMLSDFLPSRYRVSRGAFIIDSKGAKTSEIDLVVHDNYFHPELFEEATRRLIPAESVYAVFEIKPALNKTHLAYAIKKAVEVRRLHRTSGAVIQAGGDIPKDEVKKPLWITAGILTSKGSWGEPFGRNLEKGLAAASENGRLELGYAVADGAFEAFYDNSGISIEAEAMKTGLLFFLTRLFTRLQRAGSVPVIDLAAYQDSATSD